MPSEKVIDGSEATGLISGRQLESWGISAKFSLVTTIDEAREEMFLVYIADDW